MLSGTPPEPRWGARLLLGAWLMRGRQPQPALSVWTSLPHTSLAIFQALQLRFFVKKIMPHLNMFYPRLELKKIRKRDMKLGQLTWI